MALTVMFGEEAATDVTVVSDTEATVTAPAGTGTVDVVITTAGGTDTLEDGYTYAAEGG